MKGKIEKAILSCKMDNAYKKVIIGFSGGADSSALVHYFKDKAQSVVCVHINHMIRGEEADRDEAFCASVCKKYGIELVVKRIDIPALSSERGKGLEETAREERYRVFEEECRTRGFDAILTAHNADDNIESVVFNLARGSGANGLSGIKPVNGKLLRPLIYASRQEIVAYCEQNNIEYVTDSTNSDIDYTRNYIRHEIVPSLKKLNPGIDVAVARLTSSLREDEDCLNSMAIDLVKGASDGFKIYVDAVKNAPQSVLARALKIVSGVNLDYISTKRCVELIKNGKCSDVINLCKGVSLKRERDFVEFIKTEALKRISFEKKLNTGANEIEEVGTLWLDFEPDADCPKIYLKQSAINGELYVRSRREGDTVKHGRMTKKIKKLLCDKKIPSHLRDRIPIICDDNGILAVFGVAIRDGAAGTKKDIAIHFLPVED